MKHLVNSALALTAGFSLLSASASAGTITDNYWGADDHGHQDIVGDSDLFDSVSADITRSGNQLVVVIHTNFGPNTGGTSGQGGLAVYPGLTQNGQGIGFGDLFLATSWTPTASAGNHYVNDDASTGTLWQYGFAIDHPWSATGGNGKLYALNGNTNNKNIQLSNHYISGGVYRNGQEVSVRTGSRRHPNANVSDTGNTGTWTIASSGATPLYDLTFTVDITGTTLASSDYLAMRWAPTCANDVITGGIELKRVPEPAPLALLLGGSMLLAGSLIRRRRAAHSSSMTSV